MAIAFKEIPQDIRVPLFYAEIDPSQANTNQTAQRTLLIGGMTSAGSATANMPSRIASPTDAANQFGIGSILADETQAYIDNDTFGEVWGLPLADAGGATAATGTIVYTGPATGSGVIALYVAGVNLPVAVVIGMTATQIGTAVAAAINAADIVATATASAGTVTLTARNKGLTGNDIDIRHNYRGTANGEVLPGGVTATVTAMSGGATNPTLTTALANLVDKSFDFIVSPYTDPTSIAAISAFLNDTTGRWSWQTQIYGHQFIAYRGTISGLGTFGATVNDQHLTCMGFYDSPSTAWEWAAAVAGAAAVSIRADPGTPLQTVAVAGVLAPPLTSRFTLPQRNALLYDGISTFRVGAGGSISLENVITTYQTNALGQADDSYLEIETMFLLMYVLRALAAVINTQFARCKLAADGTRIAAGSNLVTPSTIKAALIAQYQTLEDGGYVQNSQAFAAGLVVQQNATNPNRVDVLWPAILVDQLRIFAVLAQFRLTA